MVLSSDLLGRFLGATDTELGLPTEVLYRVFIKDAQNRRIAELTDWTALDFVSVFNGVGTWSLETSAENREISLLTKSGGIVVTRTIESVESTIFSGFVWTEWGYTGTAFRAAGYCDNALLWIPTRPEPARAGPPFSEQYYVRTQQASSLMIHLVDVTCGISGPAEWRITGTVASADPLLGSVITARAGFQPLLTLLQEIALTPYAGGLGFYLRSTDTVANGIQFVVYAPPDRSADAKFSLDLGTAQDYEDIQSAPEANHVFVLGSGLGAARLVIEAQDIPSIAEWGRRISTVVDQRDVDDPSELQQKAAEAVAGMVTRRRSAIVPFDVPSLQYGVDYDLGTLITLVTPVGETVDLIRQVEISLDPERGPIITPVVGEGTGDDEQMANITRTIQNRITNLERNWNVPPESIDATMLQTNAVGVLEIQANAVTESKLDALDVPTDNEILTFDATSGRFEWQAINALAANLSITSLTASGNVQGARLISTVATGTAPLSVSSTTVVTSLNADLLDGQHASAFALDTDLANYLLLTGGTISGGLTVQGTFAADGAVLLGNNIADTVTIAGPVTMGSTLGVTGDITANDVTATGQVVAQGVSSSSGLTLSGPSNIDGNGGTAGQIRIGAVIINASSLTGSEELLVNGQSVFQSTATFNGQAAFNDPVTFVDTPQVVGTDLDMSTAYVDFDSSSTATFSSGSGFTNATFSGWLAVKVRGVVKYVPYYSSAPS